MNDIYFRITDNCNLRCAHCCYDSGPGGHTMPLDDIKRALHNLSQPNELTISGGEPFTVWPTLKRMLEYLRERRDTLLAEKGSVTLQTNAYWVRDADSTLRRLREIYDLGVDRLDIPSYDEYHEAQGVDVRYLDDDSPLYLAVKALRAERSPLQVFVRGTNDIMPVGRGKQLHNIMERYTCQVQLESALGKGYTITVSPDGRAYPCNWGLTPPLGSVLEETIGSMRERAAKTRWMQALQHAGPTRLARIRRMRVGEWPENDCVLCDKLFSDKSQARVRRERLVNIKIA